jgi:hypothetical protein
MRPRCEHLRTPVRRARHVQRSCFRLAIRSAHRGRLRPSVRHVLKDRRPSLFSIFALFNKSYRRLIKFQEKRNRQNRRFKALLSPEESERRLKENLERAYGDRAWAAMKNARPVALPIAAAPVHQAPPAPTPPPKPIPKADITAVPLVRLPNGLLGLDYNAARNP